MRGKGYRNTRRHRRRGITPAYAGKSWQSHGQCRCGRDHPRVCGEKSAVGVPTSVTRGSPPRMRGKGSGPQCGVHETGITPAYAGKRAPECMCRAGVRDHPRVCGEKSSGSWVMVTNPGSPPRMRGKAEAVRDRTASFGITPAYAGKSLT